MQGIQITLILLFSFCRLLLSAQPLSPQATISLLTYSPGTELYTVFGHSALRVRDPAQSLDKVFNYGTFDFGEPGFYLRFMQGRLKYKLSAYDYYYVEQEQARRQMDVREQEFNLTSEQRQALYDFLLSNLRPENRFYLYDFFFDNCATRIRDALEQVLGKSLQLDTVLTPSDQPRTFRELIDGYLAPLPWADFGIDLALGSSIDSIATPYQYLFLPDYLAGGLAGSTITHDGGTQPFVLRSTVILPGTREAEPPPWYTHPRWIFTVLFGAFVLWATVARHQTVIYWPDSILLILYGLLGVLLLLLWLATDHQATRHNWNLLWAHPLHLLSVVLLTRGRQSHAIRFYFLLHGFFYVGLLAAWDLVPQAYHPAAIPLVMLLAFRYFYQYYQINLRRQTRPDSALPDAARASG